MADIAGLRRKPLFLGFSERQLRAILSIVRERRFARQQVVVRAGEEGTSLFVLQHGSVEVHAPPPPGAAAGEAGALLAVLHPASPVDGVDADDFFGEFCLIDLEPRSATVVTREETLLWELDRDELYHLFHQDIDLQIGIVRNIARALGRRLRLQVRRTASGR